MLISSLLGIPLLGMLTILCVPKTSVRLIRGIAILATALTFVVSLSLLQQFQPSVTTMQFVERLEWIPQLHIAYQVGLDGISLPLVLLTTLLALLACIGSWSITQRFKEYYILYLLLELGMLGTFVATDLFLFYVFWEVVLVPMYFLIGIWGGGRREYSAFKFFVYTLAGSLAMLLGMLALYFKTQTFDLVALAQHGPLLDPRIQQWLFLAFFFGFAIKVPVFPFHTWLPDAHVDAPTPISMILAGVLLKMGGYGFLRISYPLFPAGAHWFGWTMAGLGMINIVYGAWVALAQTDFKRLVAYSSVSHMGFVLLGLSSFSMEGMNGALLQMFNHGIITGAMFFLVGVLYDRTHTRELTAFGGLGVKVPVYAGLLIFFSLASLGLPGLAGFVSEFLSLVGGYSMWRWQTIVSLLGIVVTAAYTLTALQRILLGPLNQKWAGLPDMRTAEISVLVPLLLLVLLVGLYPMSVLQWQQPTLDALLQHLGH